MTNDQTPAAESSLQLTGKPDANGMYALYLSQEELAAFANNGGGTAHFGPVTLTYNYSLVPLQFIASATMLGVTSEQVTLNAAHPTASISISKSGFTVNFYLTLGIGAMNVQGRVVVMAQSGTIIDKQFTISL